MTGYETLGRKALAARKELVADALEQLEQLRPFLTVAGYNDRLDAIQEARTEVLADWRALISYALRKD